MERGIEVEAGLWQASDAEALAGTGLVESWGAGSRGRGRRHLPVRRILIEPHEAAGEDAVARAVEIGTILDPRRSRRRACTTATARRPTR